MLHIFTHNDADGYAAGYLVYKWYKESMKDKLEYEFYFMNYGDEFPFNKIGPKDTVFITDYSLEPSDLIKLYEITPGVIWIDHHISSINKYNDWYDLIKEKAKVLGFDKKYPVILGLRMNGISGSALTFLCLYKGWDQEQLEAEIDDMGEKATFEDAMDDLKDAPIWLQMINDWDVWRHEIEDTKPFMTALSNRLSMSEFKLLDGDKKYYESLVELGKLYLGYRNNWASQLREKYGFESTICYGETAYPVYVLNVGNANSDYFGDLIDKYSAVISFNFNGNRYVYSMYSTKPEINCAELCAALGVDNGGGHKGAAGFTHKDLLFKKNEPTWVQK